MRELKYIPELCKGDDKKFEGYVIITCPTFNERYKLFDAASFETDEKGQIVQGIKQMNAINNIVSKSEKHYKEVSLKKLSDGTEIKSFEDMTYDSDCDAILIEVGTQIMNGFKVSKN